MLLIGKLYVGTTSSYTVFLQEEEVPLELKSSLAYLMVDSLNSENCSFEYAQMASLMAKRERERWRCRSEVELLVT
jgi:hypothetical protein